MNKSLTTSLRQLGLVLACMLVLASLFTDSNLILVRARFPVIDLKPAVNGLFIAFFFPILFCFYKRWFFRSVLLFALQFSLSYYFLFLHNELGFENDFNDNAGLMNLTMKLYYHGFGTDLFSAQFHNSYPFLWYYFCLKLQLFWGGNPIYTIKLAQNLACFLIPVLTYFSWCKVQAKPFAAMLAMSSLVYLDFFKVNAWLGLVLVIPWILYVVRILKTPSVFKWQPWDFFVLGAIAVFQYYWILMAALFVPSLWVLTQAEFYKSLIPNKKSLFYILSICIGGFVLSLPYTGPYAMDLLQNPSEPLVNRCYFDPMSLWHFPMNSPRIVGFVSTIGLVAMAFFFPKVRIIRSVFFLFLIALFFFYLLSSSMLLRFPSNFTKIEYILTYLLVLGFGMMQSVWYVSLKNRIHQAALVFTCILVSHVSLSSVEVDSQFRPPLDKINDLKTLIPKVDTKSTTLSSVGRPLFYLPFFSFIPFNLHWSNPCMLYSNRAEFIWALQKCQSPSAISYALKHNKFEAVDLLIFEFNKLDVVLEKDNFPEPQSSETITFTRGQLLPPAFEYSPTRQYEVFRVRDEKDWMSALSNRDKQLFQAEIEKLKPFLSER